MSRRHTSDDWGIYQRPDGSFRVEVSIGSKGSPAFRRERARFEAGTPKADMRAWRNRALLKLETLHGQTTATAAPDTLAAAVPRYFASTALSPKTAEARVLYLAWWAAQSAALGAPVLSPADVRAGTRGAGVTLGETLLARLDPKRLRECLTVAFAPTDAATDPTEFAGTSNHYRTALSHLWTVLFEDDMTAPRSPIGFVKKRPMATARPHGADMRVVAEIVKHAVSDRYGRNEILAARLAVLQYVHITPRQLGQLKPSDFHDIADATRDEQIAGLITITKRPRLKGRKGRTIPAPETIPLTPYGVTALRALAAANGWNTLDLRHYDRQVCYMNKRIKRGAVAAQAIFAARGVTLDLGDFELYHLKHSLATAASVASNGAVDRDGMIRQSPGVQRALDHAAPQMTAVYTQAAVDPIVRQVSAALSVHLDRLFAQPLTGLRIVTGSARGKRGAA